MGFISHAEMMDLRERNGQRRLYEERVLRQEREDAARRLERLRQEQMKEAAVQRASNQIIHGNATEADIQMITDSLQIWRKTVLQMDANQARALIEKGHLFPKKMQEELNSILPILKIKTFSFTNGFIQRSELNNLLFLMKQALLIKDINPTKSDSLLMTKLMIFVDNINNGPLDEKQILCLKRITDDYQINLLGKNSPIEGIIVNQLLTSTTLSQLTPQNKTTAELDINAGNFLLHLTHFEQRIQSLPLNNDTKRTIHEVILPGISTIIHREQEIVDYARDHHGRIYDLNDRLPLHTDHAPSNDPEAYRLSLHRLLINFFAAADIAYNSGHLNQFCEKICQGYCFEGRVRDVFEWVSTLFNVASFHENMEKYYQKEYIPYTEVMIDKRVERIEELASADPIVAFIMARHQNAPCLEDSTYAPTGKITRLGVTKYLSDILDLKVAPERHKALEQIRALRCSLKQKQPSLWSNSSAILTKNKIDALSALELSIVREEQPINILVKNIKDQYPMALSGLFSRTKKLLTELERVDTSLNKQETLSNP